MRDEQLRIGFIGAGNMATAMIRGIITSGMATPANIYIYDIDPQKVEALTSPYGVTAAASSISLARECTLIIPSVKPQHLPGVLAEIKDALTEEHLILSIAAGISTETLRNAVVNRCGVLRTMPNTPALVGEGMTAICVSEETSDAQLSLAKRLFSSFGRYELIEEKQIHGATAVSGSSPAYAFLFIEALADGGVRTGLTREQSYRLAAQALLGAAKMVLETHDHPGLLKDRVCSPGGTTIEAVSVLEQNRFRSAVMEAVRVCAEKSEEMGRKQ